MNPPSSQIAGHLNKAPIKIQSLSLLIGVGGDRQPELQCLFQFHCEGGQVPRHLWASPPSLQVWSGCCSSAARCMAWVQPAQCLPFPSSLCCCCKRIDENHLCSLLKQNHPEILISPRAFLLICLLKFSKGLFSGLKNVLGVMVKEVWFLHRVGSTQLGAS